MFDRHDAIALIDASSLGPSKIPQPWTQAYSFPDLFTTCKCTTWPAPSSSWFPETCNPLAFGGAWTEDVAADVAPAEPPPLLAVTCERIVCPWSADVGVYTDVVAVMICVHPAPVESQSNHLYVYVIGVVPDQVPFDVVSTLPTRAVPAIAGRAVFVGAI